MTSRSEENSGLVDIPALMDQMRIEAAQQRPIVIHLTAPIPTPLRVRAQSELGSPIGFVAAALAISLASNAFALAQIAGPFVFSATEPETAWSEPAPNLTATVTAPAPAPPIAAAPPEPLALLLPALAPESIHNPPPAAPEPSPTLGTKATDPTGEREPEGAPTPELEPAGAPSLSPLSLTEAMQAAAGESDTAAEPASTARVLVREAKQVRPAPGALFAALSEVQNEARTCLGAGDSPRSCTVTFRSDGTVAGAVVPGDDAAASCIRAALTQARVDAFSQETYHATIRIRGRDLGR